MSETKLIESETFEQRLRGRIKESIGELLSDDDLSKLIERGIEETFFCDKPIKDARGFITGLEQPLMQGLLTQLLDAKVKSAVDVWVTQNADKLNEILEQVVREGITRAVLTSLDNKFQRTLYTMKSVIMSELER